MDEFYFPAFKFTDPSASSVMLLNPSHVFFSAVTVFILYLCLVLTSFFYLSVELPIFYIHSSPEFGEYFKDHYSKRSGKLFISISNF